MAAASEVLGLDGVGQLSDDKLLSIVRLIDGLASRGEADRVLRGWRPRLALLRPPRAMTLSRVLVQPLEDLLVDAGDHWPGRRRISRATLGPLRELGLGALPAPHRAELEAGMAGQSMQSAKVLLEAGAAIWPAAARALGEAVAAGGQPAETRRQLGGAAHVLLRAEAMLPVLWRLPPKPMVALDAKTIGALVALLRSCAEAGEEALLWLLELLLARSASPDVILVPLMERDLGLPTASTMALVRRIVQTRVGDMREMTTRLAQSPALLDGRSVRDVLQLVADLDAMTDRAFAGGLDKRLLADIRHAAMQVIDRCLEAAVGSHMLAQLGSLHASAGLDDAAMERLEDQARAARRLGIAGAQLGVAATAEAVLDPYLRTYEDMLAAQPPGLSGPRLFDHVRVMEILFGPDVAMAAYDRRRAGIRQTGRPRAAR